jgi:hypothetical protein
MRTDSRASSAYTQDMLSQAEEQASALEGQKSQCYQSIDEIMSGGYCSMSGNKTESKLVCKLGYFLLDFDDG